MSATDTIRTIESVKATGPAHVRLRWSDGAQSELDLSDWLKRPAFAALRDPAAFAKVEVGDWGHSLRWPSGAEAGADSLWLETLSASKREDARAFLEWRLKHGLSLSKAADALGLSRRMIAYYSNAEKPVPRTVLLACRGWESGNRRLGGRKRTAANASDTHLVSWDIASLSASPTSTGKRAVSERKATHMPIQRFFVERRPEGDYAIRRPNSERASSVKATQAEAIGRAKELDPRATILVERVRNTDRGHPDKWRKA
jgi:hypothetical protein